MVSKRSLFCALGWALLTLAAAGCGGRGALDEVGSTDRLGEDKQTAYGLLESGRFQDAVDLLAPWAETKVGDPQVFSMLGKAQWKLGDHDDAVGNYENALRLDYTAAYAHLELAELLVEMGKSGRAITEFELAIKYGERDPVPHYNYGLALFETGRQREALEQWKVAYSLNDQDAEYAEAMGIGLTEVDDAAAVEYFERAADLGADHAGFHNNFGLLLQRLGDYDRAEAEFKKAVSIEPTGVPYRRNLAVLYMVSGRFDASTPLWEALLEEEPENQTYRIYLARARLELGRFDSAIKLLEDWVREPDAGGAKTAPAGKAEGPTVDEAYEVLAMSYRGKGDLDRAGSYIRKALEIQPDRVAYLINYGVILADGGKIAEAKAQWERVLQIDPENPTARQNLCAFER